MPSLPDKKQRYRQYLVFRLLLVALCFGLIPLHRVLIGPLVGNVGLLALYVLLGAYLVFATASSVLASRTRLDDSVLRRFVLADIGVQALIVGLSGGVLSIFCPLLFVTLVAATGLLRGKDSIVLSTVISLVLCAATVAYATGALAFTTGLRLEGGSIPWIHLFASVLGIYAISALGARYTQRVRSVEGIHREILESMGDGLIALDAYGTLFQFNREARQLLGVSDREGLPGSSLDELRVCPGGQAVIDAMRAPDDSEMVVKLRPPNGDGEVPVHVRVSRVRDHEGTNRCRVALLSDRSLEREVEIATERIEQLESLRVMALGIAHEIRNPLASIRGCVQEIGRASPTDDRNRRLTDIVCRESDRLDYKLEAFLQFARPEPAERCPLDLAEVIDEASLLVRTRQEFAGRTLEWNCEDRPILVRGNRHRLVQVFLNLGLNAVDATTDEDGIITVRLRRARIPSLGARGSATAWRPGVEIDYADNGRGLDPETRKQLFTPFFTTKATGHGLGLSIVQRIVAEHEGTIEVEAGTDGGTVFRLRLPVLVDAGDGLPTPRVGEHEEQQTEQLCHA